MGGPSPAARLAIGPVILFLFLLSLVLAACGAEALPTSAPLASMPTPSDTPSVAATVAPPPTETSLPAVTPTNAPDPTETPLPSPTPCAAAGSVITDTFASATAGGEQDVRLYLPPCYGDDGRAYPTLYLFAGNVHDESKWDELGVDEAADSAISQGTMAPLLIVMPDGGPLANNTSGGPGSYESLVLNELIPFVEEEYCAWPQAQGRAIGGLSRGGYWALEIAFRFPQRFASAGGHSAALLDQFAGPTINPQQTALSNDLGDLRIYLDIGAQDYLRANTIQLHEDMEAAGVRHTWVLQEGRHEDAYWAAHVADYLQWYAEPWPVEREGYADCG